MKFGLKIGILVLGCWGGCFTLAQAQVFGGESETANVSVTKTESEVSRPQKRTGWWERFQSVAPDTQNTSRLSQNNTLRQNTKNQVQYDAVPENKENQKPKSPPAKIDVTDPENYIYRYMPREKRPTLDGVKRGTSAIFPVYYPGAEKAEDEPLIFLFYSDFNVEKLMSGTVICNVRFQILTTLNSKLTNLSVRLRWPEMETTLSFIDVPPNQMVHYDYALMGDGCYSMDKIPNIVVNRCRAKGLSQKNCAAKIRWIRK